MSGNFGTPRPQPLPLSQAPVHKVTEWRTIQKYHYNIDFKHLRTLHQTNRALVFRNEKTTDFGFLNNLKSENYQLWVFEKIHNRRTALQGIDCSMARTVHWSKP
jgi:hypothetical protein